MKLRSLIFPVLLIVGLLIISCNDDRSRSEIVEPDSAESMDLAAMRSIIEEKNNVFTEAHITGKKDSAVMVNYFTTDARIFPPNADAVIGLAAIAELTSLYMDYEISDFREETTSFYGNEEYLIDEGNYTMIYGEESIVENGKYVNVWKKENGEWKVYSNIWNANAPPAAAE
jgi:ketosteroid isomerase-like protein